jgi:gas vesicle protein
MYDRRSADAALFFVLGGLTGACFALLFAPRPGWETRALIGDRVREGGDLAQRALERSREAVTRTVREGRELAQRAIDRGREAFESAGYLHAGHNGQQGETQEGPA